MPWMNWPFTESGLVTSLIQQISITVMFNMCPLPANIRITWSSEKGQISRHHSALTESRLFQEGDQETTFQRNSPPDSHAC